MGYGTTTKREALVPQLYFLWFYYMGFCVAREEAQSSSLKSVHIRSDYLRNYSLPLQNVKRYGYTWLCFGRSMVNKAFKQNNVVCP